MKKPLPEDLKATPIAEFIDNVIAGAISDYDGWGYYSDGEYMYEVVDLSIPPKDYTHVVWVNK